MAKVSITIETKADDTIITCPFPPRWVEQCMLDPDAKSDLRDRLDAFEKLNDRSAAAWKKLCPSDEILDLLWASERANYIKNELAYGSFLPDEWRDIIKSIIKDGPHRVSAKASTFEAIGILLEGEAWHVAAACDYELQVFTNVLRGRVE